MATKRYKLSQRATIAIALLTGGMVLFFIPYGHYISLPCFISGLGMAIYEMKEQAVQHTQYSTGSRRLSVRAKVGIIVLALSLVWCIVYLVNSNLWWTILSFFACLIIGLLLLTFELRRKGGGEHTQTTKSTAILPTTEHDNETKSAHEYIDLSASYRPATIVLLHERYEIIKKIAEGGMSIINLAKDHLTKTMCIIKVPRSTTHHDPRINIEKLTIEAEYLRKFQHPHIVRFIDLFRYDHIPHLVVEYIEGENLLEAYAKAPAEEGAVLLWAGQILDALRHLHRQGLIHRDINPGNIMVRKDNTAVIIDFGTVKDISSKDNPESKNYTIITKSGFSIPELLTTGHADERADLCGVGNTLFYLLTSTRPGLRGSTADTTDVLTARGVSERTAKCIDQAMNSNPDLRFKDAGAMRQALGV